MRYIVTAIKERSSIIDYLKSKIPELEIVWDEKKTIQTHF
jgi:hypothetical protein